MHAGIAVHAKREFISSPVAHRSPLRAFKKPQPNERSFAMQVSKREETGPSGFGDDDD